MTLLSISNPHFELCLVLGLFVVLCVFDLLFFPYEANNFKRKKKHLS